MAVDGKLWNPLYDLFQFGEELSPVGLVQVVLHHVGHDLGEVVLRSVPEVD